MSAAFTAREPVPAPPPLTGVVQRKAEQAAASAVRLHAAAYTVGPDIVFGPGATVGAGLSYDFGPAQLGLVYDYLKASADKDPDAHRTFLRLGLRF